MGSMAESPATAPVLSTPDSHILTEVEPSAVAASSPRLSDEQFRIRYEIDHTIEEIRSYKWRRIALQFPDHMLPDSARVYDMLSRGVRSRDEYLAQPQASSEPQNLSMGPLDLNRDHHPLKLTILADTSYGSCCVDEVAAEHVDADAVVHYGRACLSPTARLPVLHIYTRTEIDVAAAAEAFVETFSDHNTKVILTADIPYASHVQQIYARLLEGGYHNVFAADIVHDPSSLIPNRTLPQEVLTDPAELSSWHLYHIAEPPTALLLNLSSKVASIRIHEPTLTGTSSKAPAQEANTSMVLRRRYALVTSMNTVSTWGILINTLSVKNYLHVVDHVKKLIAESGKKSYLFVVGKLNAAKVANFSEIGGWVVIGCWESSLIDSRDFYKPILTPFELEMALAADESRIWTGAWRSDFEGVLEVKKSSANRAAGEEHEGDSEDAEQGREYESEEESAPPEFDLRTGKYVSQSRPMGRLRENGHTEVHEYAKASSALTRRANGDLVAENGIASPAADYLASKRTWKGLGSDFEIKYEDEDVEGAQIEEGRSGMARGYTVGESVQTR